MIHLLLFASTAGYRADLRLNPAALNSYPCVAVVEAAQDLTPNGPARVVPCSVVEGLKGPWTDAASLSVSSVDRRPYKPLGLVGQKQRYLVFASRSLPGAAGTREVELAFPLPAGYLAPGQDIPARLYRTLASECSSRDPAVVARVAFQLGNCFGNSGSPEYVEGLEFFPWVKQKVLPGLLATAGAQSPHNAYRILCAVADGDLTYDLGDRIVAAVSGTAAAGEAFDPMDGIFAGHVSSQCCHSPTKVIAALARANDPYVKLMLLGLAWDIDSDANLQAYARIAEREPDTVVARNMLLRESPVFGIDVPDAVRDPRSSRESLQPYIEKLKACKFVQRRK